MQYFRAQPRPALIPSPTTALNRPWAPYDPRFLGIFFQTREQNWRVRTDLVTLPPPRNRGALRAAPDPPPLTAAAATAAVVVAPLGGRAPSPRNHLTRPPFHTPTTTPQASTRWRRRRTR